MNKKIKIWLFLIILLAAFLRFWQIDKYPAGFNADEAAYGYNAYSLLKTGKDEFGVSWPVHLKSFDDYKPAGTTYFVLPFVALLGLTEFAVRLPSLLAGVASVFLIFLFTWELFQNEYLSLIAAFFLSISPWHIHFSRGAWETNLGTTFLLLGLWLFFKGLKETRYLTGAVISFAVSIYIYHSPRVVIPLLGVFLAFFYWKKVFRNLKQLGIAVLVGLLVMAPFIFSIFGPAVSARFSGIGVFSDVGPFGQIIALRSEHPNMNFFPWRLLHNRLVAYAFKVLENWLSHFDPTFLFVIGDKIKRSNSPDMGEMYLIDLLFSVAGIYYFCKNRPKNFPFIFFWLIVAPLAASLTFQTPSVLRAHNMVIPLTIICAYGFYNLFVFLKKNISKSLFVACNLVLVIFIIWDVSYFFHQYTVHYPKAYPEAWEYGVKDLVSFLEPIKNNYQKIYVTEKYDQPYIIFLFYLKYPPSDFQKEAVLTTRDKFGFSTVRDFDKYHFENINWQTIKSDRGNLACGTDEEIPEEAQVIKEIYFRNGKPAYQCAKI